MELLTYNSYYNFIYNYNRLPVLYQYSNQVGIMTRQQPFTTIFCIFIPPDFYRFRIKSLMQFYYTAKLTICHRTPPQGPP